MLQTGWSAYGASADNPISVHLIILENISGIIDVSATSNGTGNASIKGFGFK